MLLLQADESGMYDLTLSDRKTLPECNVIKLRKSKIVTVIRNDPVTIFVQCEKHTVFHKNHTDCHTN